MVDPVRLSSPEQSRHSDHHGVSTMFPETSFVAVEGLSKSFPMRKGFFGKPIGEVQAVRNVSFGIGRGETLALMGESGCGKTTCGLVILRLLSADAGHVRVGTYDVFGLSRREGLAFRQDAQIIFQDPQEALNPRMSVRSLILEPMAIHGRLEEGKQRLEELVSRVMFPLKYLDSYPDELSGGLQQRVCLCRALILQPSFLILDEPTSALDVSVQASVLDLLLELRRELGLTYLFVSHDAAVVRYISDWVGVMYLGEIVEHGRAEHVFDNCLHPYTRALYSAVLSPESRVAEKKILLHGCPPSPTSIPEGCAFRTRCWLATDVCERCSPRLRQAGPDHYVACHHFEAARSTGEV